MSERARTSSYGSAEWFERAYLTTASDPWGLGWRPTQLYRYGCMVSELLESLSACHQDVRSVLDVGCATGDFTHLLASALPRDPSRRVVGTDLSPTAIQRAKAKYPQLEFYAEPLGALHHRFAPTFDLVCCLEVLYYVPAEDRADALEALASMLRPGGLLLVSSMVGKPPYMDGQELRNLIGKRFRVMGGSPLDLWPLVAIEKAILSTLRVSWRPQAASFLPGRRGFLLMRNFGRVCKALFGTRATSHTYVLAVRPPG